MSELEEMRQRLVDRGFLSQDAQMSPVTSGERPWFVSLVLGTSGWLAGLFGIIFVGLIFTPDSAFEFALAGAIMLGAAYGLYAVDRESAFFDQLALALSIAGQLAMTGAAWEATESVGGTAALVALMQVLLVFIMPNRLAKLLATFFACVAWALALRFAWWGDDVRGHTEAASLAGALLGWVVIWIPIAAATHLLIQREAEWLARGAQRYVRPVLSGLLLSLAVGTWVSEPIGSLEFWSPSPQTNWLALWPLLAAGAALFAALCAFRLRNRALIGVAISGALLHIVQFYFLLGTSLLMKSCIMLIVGLALQACAVSLARRADWKKEARA